LLTKEFDTITIDKRHSEEIIEKAKRDDGLAYSREY
jgi:hypothetical protein